MAETISLTEVMQATDQALPSGLLVSDTSGQVEAFFK